jgi:hypothetical protein
MDENQDYRGSGAAVLAAMSPLGAGKRGGAHCAVGAGEGGDFPISGRLRFFFDGLISRY